MGLAELEMCPGAVLVATAEQSGASCFVSSTEISEGVTTPYTERRYEYGFPGSDNGLGNTLRPRLM